MEEKALQRHGWFRQCLAGLKEAKYRDPSDEFVQSGTVRKFCLTFDLSWKVMRDLARRQDPAPDFIEASPRECLKAAYDLELIFDDRWYQMLSLRNALEQDYDGNLAAQSFDRIVKEYVPLFSAFAERAEGYLR